jgi:phage terminase small subunit
MLKAVSGCGPDAWPDWKNWGAGSVSCASLRSSQPRGSNRYAVNHLIRREKREPAPPPSKPAAKRRFQVKRKQRETPMRDRFVLEYLKDFNATRAAIRSGYSPKTAASQGQRLLKSPIVGAAISKAQIDLLKATEVSPERVLKALAETAFLDPGEFFDNHGKLRPIDKMPQAARRHILDVLKVEELFENRRGKTKHIGRRYKLNLSCKSAALKALVKYLQKSTAISRVAGDDKSEPKSPSPAEMKGRGSFRQQRFAVEYLKDSNATQAAIRAGYSPKTAASQGQRLLISPTVGAAIAQARSKLLKNSEISIERCRNELASIAFFDFGDCFDKKGSLLPINRMPERARRALTRFEFEELFDSDRVKKMHIGRYCKITYSKEAALEMLAEDLKLINPKGRESRSHGSRPSR